jgi:hypothetical protein
MLLVSCVRPAVWTTGGDDEEASLWVRGVAPALKRDYCLPLQGRRNNVNTGSKLICIEM